MVRTPARYSPEYFQGFADRAAKVAIPNQGLASTHSGKNRGDALRSVMLCRDQKRMQDRKDETLLKALGIMCLECSKLLPISKEEGCA